MASLVASAVQVHGRSLELILGDIVHQQVDAIVNAANSRLAGGGGVDGAIHRAGGPAIIADTRQRYPNGCPTGSAVISVAGQLPFRHVIHAVGPVWSGGTHDEEQLLRSAYRASLQLASEHGCQSVAFPALSTGAYRYPLDGAARAAIAATLDFLHDLPADDPPSTVRFVLFSVDSLAAFREALGAASD